RSSLWPVIPRLGRAVAYAGSAYGTTALRPSLPPPSWRTTRTRSLWMPSLVAASTPLASTAGTVMPTAVDSSPLARKSRRVSIGSVLLQVELGAAENRVPAVGVRLAGVEHRRRVRAHGVVELGADRLGGVGEAAAAVDHGLGEVGPREHRARRDPGRVLRPATDGRRVEEDLVHLRARGHAAGRQ